MIYFYILTYTVFALAIARVSYKQGFYYGRAEGYKEFRKEMIEGSRSVIPFDPYEKENNEVKWH